MKPLLMLTPQIEVVSGAGEIATGEIAFYTHGNVSKTISRVSKTRLFIKNRIGKKYESYVFICIENVNSEGPGSRTNQNSEIIYLYSLYFLTLCFEHIKFFFWNTTYDA